jgi:hypothetical protein
MSTASMSEIPMVNVAVLVMTHEHRHILKKVLLGSARERELLEQGFEVYETHPMYQIQWQIYENYDRKFLGSVLT